MNILWKIILLCVVLSQVMGSPVPEGGKKGEVAEPLPPSGASGDLDTASTFYFGLGLPGYGYQGGYYGGGGYNGGYYNGGGYNGYGYGYNPYSSYYGGGGGGRYNRYW